MKAKVFLPINNFSEAILEWIIFSTLTHYSYKAYCFMSMFNMKYCSVEHKLVLKIYVQRSNMFHSMFPFKFLCDNERLPVSH